MTAADISRQLDTQIEALRSAVSLLREMGVEILSASVCPLSTASIHVIEPGPLAGLPGRYTRCVFDTRRHLAVPFGGCEVVWIEPTVTAGHPPAEFTH